MLLWLRRCTKKGWGWRVIYHLSAPHGSSINDHIDPSRFSLHYYTIDAAISIINGLGPGTLMGKLDLKNAFRLIPVRREDWHQLGIHWQDQWYLGKCLPFGLRSSPALFTQLAVALEWIVHNNYAVTHIIHYLNNFFTADPLAQTCARTAWMPWPRHVQLSMSLSNWRKPRALQPPSHSSESARIQ